MLPFDCLKVSAKGLLDGRGEHRVAVSVALPASNDDLIPGEIDIFDSEAATLHQPQPGPVEEHRHQPWRPLEAPEDESYLVLRQNYGQPFRPLGAHDALEEADLSVQNLTVKKQEGVQRLILRRAVKRCCVLAGESPAWGIVGSPQ